MTSSYNPVMKTWPDPATRHRRVISLSCADADADGYRDDAAAVILQPPP